jgi:DNA-binding transcriptional MerR regulator
MPDFSAQVEIPKRALFKAAEVCDLAKVQPYVLRSWESEFPELGVTKTSGAPRVYRREDVEQVLRIKHLLLVEGLTLAGARRRLDEESATVAPDAPVIDELIGRNARERLTEVKRGLQSILELLGRHGDRAGDDEFRLAPPSARTPPRVRSMAAGHVKQSRGKTVARHGSARSPQARRKRPA